MWSPSTGWSSRFAEGDWWKPWAEGMCRDRFSFGGLYKHKMGKKGELKMGGLQGAGMSVSIGGQGQGLRQMEREKGWLQG